MITSVRLCTLALLVGQAHWLLVEGRLEAAEEELQQPGGPVDRAVIDDMTDVSDWELANHITSLRASEGRAEIVADATASSERWGEVYREVFLETYEDSLLELKVDEVVPATEEWNMVIDNMDDDSSWTWLQAPTSSTGVFRYNLGGRLWQDEQGRPVRLVGRCHLRVFLAVTGRGHLLKRMFVDHLTLIGGRLFPDPTEPPSVRIRPPFPQGSIAIWRDRSVPGLTKGCADPEELALLLRRDRRHVALIDSEQLADPQAFNASRFHLVVLPYGACFPVSARTNFLRFLRAGGDFISMGGIAFDEPLVKQGGKWFTREIVETGRLDVGSLGDEEHLFGEWYNRESGHYEWGGQPYAITKRWTGARCGAWLRVDPDHSYRLRVSLSYAGGWYDKCVLRRREVSGRVFVSGSLVGRFAGERGCEVVEFPVPRTLLQRGRKATVGLEVSTWSVSEITGWRIPDKRRLGVAVDWIRLEPVEKSTPGKPAAPDFHLTMTTRHGDPRDWLIYGREQLGVFDPSYELTRVAYARAAPGQQAIEPGLRLPGPLRGYVACAVTGVPGSPNAPIVRARWVPLINGYDRFGRPRGALASMVLNYQGRYAGSCWVCFGVTNVNLFDRHRPAMRKALRDIVSFLLRETYLFHTETQYAAYRQNEPITVRTQVANFGSAGRALTVRFRVVRAGEPRPVLEKARAIEVLAGRCAPVEETWVPHGLAGDLYEVTAVLEDAGQRVDAERTGFVVNSEPVLRSAPRLTWRENYFWLDDRPVLLVGSTLLGNLYWSPGENPLVWDRSLEQMADLGLNAVRLMGLSSAAVDYSSPTVRLPERTARTLDALIQLCQKHRLMPLLLVGADEPGFVEPEAIDRHGRFAEAVANRYQNVPAIAYDIQNEPFSRWWKSPQRNALFNEFLRQRYETDERLRTAWAAHWKDSVLGQVNEQEVTEEWDDVKTVDVTLFNQWLMERWLSEVRSGIAPKPPGRPVTVGHGSAPILNFFADQLDFFNTHYYWQDSLPVILKLSDKRAVGQGLTLGEFGAKSHPSWRGYRGQEGGYMTPAEAADYFLAVGHYALGCGGSLLINWDWSDSTELVFPWGLTHRCDQVPKPVAEAYSQMSTLFSGLRPIYHPPTVYLLLPTRHAYGGRHNVYGEGAVITGALANAIHLLLSVHVDFGVLEEDELTKLPESAQVVFYPMPFTVDDDTYELLRRFVERGGTLYISGDFSYDPNRQRTRTQRLRELAGVAFVEENFANIDYASREATAIVPAQSELRRSESQPLPGRPPALDAERNRGRGSRVGSRRACKLGLLPYKGHPCIEVKAVTAQVLAADAAGKPVQLVNSQGRGRVVYTTDLLELASLPESSQAARAIYRSVLRLGHVSLNGFSPDDPFVHTFRLPLLGGSAYVLYSLPTGESLTFSGFARPSKSHETPVSLARNRPLHPNTTTAPGFGEGLPTPPTARPTGLKGRWRPPVSGFGAVGDLLRTKCGCSPKPVTLFTTPAITLSLREGKPGLVVLGPHGGLKAVETQGLVKRGSSTLIESDCHVAVIAAEGEDLQHGASLIILPFETGTVRLHCKRMPRTAVLRFASRIAGRWRELERRTLSRANGQVVVRIGEDHKGGALFIGSAISTTYWPGDTER